MTRENLKQTAGERAASYVESGMVVGLGTGTTVAYTIKKLAERVKTGLDISGISTSLGTELMARELGIKLTTLERNPAIDITIDGADEVDPRLDLIKGMGGALLREKVVARASKVEIVVVDESKLVEVLGVKTPVPVEVLPFAWPAVKREVEGLGCSASLRKRGEKTYVTDNGHYILDCKFASIQSASELERALNDIPGAVENGLFLGLADRVIVAGQEGVRELTRT